MWPYVVAGVECVLLFVVLPLRLLPGIRELFRRNNGEG